MPSVGYSESQGRIWTEDVFSFYNMLPFSALRLLKCSTSICLWKVILM